MKNRLSVLFLLITTCFCSCLSPYFLPQPETIDINQFGSYIVINPFGKEIAGELLAADSANLTVLVRESNKSEVKSIPLNKVNYYSLRYAKSKQYGWTIPVFSLATISHGVFLIATFPINLITTIAVTGNASNAFKYYKNDISIYDLKKFSRFPQGIPANVDLSTIK